MLNAAAASVDQPYCEKVRQRIAKRIDFSECGLDTHCWVWQGPVSRDGYGIISYNSKPNLTHRVSYIVNKGPIPEGLELDHLCRNRRCCNPDHLDPVSHKENVRRGKTGEVNSHRQRSKTECKHGHPFDAKNTYYRSRGSRGCRTCNRCQAANRKASLSREPGF